VAVGVGRIRIWISCDECTTPIVERRGFDLVFRQRHHGREHVSVVSLLELLEEAQKESQSPTVQ
jgi:hypothetical protein